MTDGSMELEVQKLRSFAARAFAKYDAEHAVAETFALAKPPPTEERDTVIHQGCGSKREMEKAASEHALDTVVEAEMEKMYIERERTKHDAEREAEEAERQARAPHLAVDNPEPQPPQLLPISVSPPDIALVVNNDAPAVDNALRRGLDEIGGLTNARIKEILAFPFDENDPHYATKVKFLSSIYGINNNTRVRVDENALRRHVVSNLPRLLEQVAEEERKREARTIEGTLHDA